jgi:hypothetical protein
MKPFRWSAEKSATLKAERGVSFESMVVAIEAGGLLDILAHPNTQKHAHQQVLVVCLDGYVYLVPFAEEDSSYFLKTVIPSRKATRAYLSPGVQDADD